MPKTRGTSFGRVLGWGAFLAIMLVVGLTVTNINPAQATGKTQPDITITLPETFADAKATLVENIGSILTRLRDMGLRLDLLSQNQNAQGDRLTAIENGTQETIAAINTTATEAKTAAKTAQETADEAKSAAADAQGTADGIAQEVTELSSTVAELETGGMNAEQQAAVEEVVTQRTQRQQEQDRLAGYHAQMQQEQLAEFHRLAGLVENDMAALEAEWPNLGPDMANAVNEVVAQVHGYVLAF